MLISPAFREMKGKGDTASLARRGAVEIIGFYPILFLLVGLPVLFLRLEDRNAWLMAMVFAGFIAISGAPMGFGVAPGWLGYFLYAYSGIVKSLLPGLFYFSLLCFRRARPSIARFPG